MKKSTIKNKNYGNKSLVYWFFRSFAISFTIVFSILTLAFGFAYCKAIGEKTLNGKAVKMIEKKQDGIYFYNNKIF